MSHQVRVSEILERWSQKPLTPADYCQIWVGQKRGIYPSDRGYRKACVAELHHVLGVSANTVNCWGSNFEKCQDVWTFLHLRCVHIMNVEREILSSLRQSRTGAEILTLLIERLEILEALISPGSETQNFDSPLPKGKRIHPNLLGYTFGYPGFSPIEGLL